MSQPNTFRVRKSTLTITRVADDKSSSYKSEAEWQAMVDRIVANIPGAVIVDLDAHDASTGRPLPSDAWEWRK